MNRTTPTPTPGDPDDIRSRVANLVTNPEAWLLTPHDLLGGRAPVELMTSDAPGDAEILNSLLDSMEHGSFT